MPLLEGKFAGKVKAMIVQLNKIEQRDQDAAISAFVKELEFDVYAAIKSITITIPIGAIVVATSNGPGVNSTPIVLNNVVK